MQARIREEHVLKCVDVLKSAELTEYIPEHLGTSQGNFQSISDYLGEAMVAGPKGQKKEQCPRFKKEKKRPQELSTRLLNSISRKDTGRNY